LRVIWDFPNVCAAGINKYKIPPFTDTIPEMISIIVNGGFYESNRDCPKNR
jgi:hypothetical protein